MVAFIKAKKSLTGLTEKEETVFHNSPSCLVGCVLLSFNKELQKSDYHTFPGKRHLKSTAVLKYRHQLVCICYS